MPQATFSRCHPEGPAASYWLLPAGFPAERALLDGSTIACLSNACSGTSPSSTPGPSHKRRGAPSLDVFNDST
jgi:hypothetical protein